MIRTRFAPSPTGVLHIGGARTALFNYLFAKKEKGEFLLRIEDTDKERSKPEFEKDIIESLKWLSLDWDGEIIYQSKRLALYEEELKKLLDEGKIFWCPHRKEELEIEKQGQIIRKESPRHFCDFREGGGEKGILRFKNDTKEKITFQDLIRGEISFEAELLGDFSIAKSFKEPLFLFANSLDDSLLGITHVIRGEDHISNTPKQLMILKALGLRKPEYAHLPLILGKDKSKLSKRHGAAAVYEYKEQGYLFQTMVNFMALLGWHPENEQEIFSKEELIEKFSIKRVQKAGAVFDLEKLNWLNKEHIKKTDNKTLVDLFSPFLKQEWRKNPEYLGKIVELEKPRIAVLKDIADKIDFFFEEPEFDKNILKWKETQSFEEVKENLSEIRELLKEIPENEFIQSKIEKILLPFADKKGRGEVLWPLRAALSGRRQSPGPFEIAEILGKEKTLKRIENALSLMK
ncbi:MAG: glutamate--tRNA ligase [Candidatus Niyogibacteria bacterium RIFCSPLOWO2_12_FULL_41_13]|uniref:Glutamate--tRNA ligase n=1 Tax=Candidatus Niyogibacteria bacterium RIFCSPLOWO2_12_FULL_41_13 TaxID=1801726 RepID=A0A1G2F2H5_9BACT|nr:MAG: glutamate--tRNA ligase [Candidatus Niyogibacteria bacterium RIFCSPLOWO2_12_FULL_41_13]